MKTAEITSALLDAYDIRNAIPAHIKHRPKDNDGTDTTIGDCLDAIIELLEKLDVPEELCQPTE